MKRTNLFIYLFIFSFCSSYGQDVIVKKDGSTILAKVKKVGANDIEFTKYKSSSDRLYTISIDNIKEINYEDGDNDNFDSDFNNPDFNVSPVYLNALHAASQGNRRYIYLPPASNNLNIIDNYRQKIEIPKYTIKHKKKEHIRYRPIMSLSDSSILSNTELEMSIVPRKYIWKVGGSNVVNLEYNFILENKTDKTIYVDKDATFKILDNGSFYSLFFDRESMTITKTEGEYKSRSVGLVVPFGSIGVEKGTISTESKSKTLTEDRYIIIPPHNTEALFSMWTRYINEKEVERMGRLYHFAGLLSFKKEDYPNDIVSKIEALKVGEYMNFNEQDGLFVERHMITYSTDENFRTYSCLFTKFYARCVIAWNMRGPVDWFDCYDSMEDLNEDYKSYISNWNDNIITGALTW